MHYYIYPNGQFGKKISIMLNYYRKDDSYEFIDDSNPETSLSAKIKNIDISSSKVIVASEKLFDVLTGNLSSCGIVDYIDGTTFYNNIMADISKQGVAAYWNAHMVANEEFLTQEDSIRHYQWRNSQYIDYINLMPVSGHDGKVILDYGCGPGNDLVGFSLYSAPKRLVGADVSATAIEKAKKRLALHGKSAEFVLIDDNSNTLNLEDNSVDYIHCSGVLMNCLNLDKILKEFYRVLKSDGRLAIMVYNHNSIWFHLYAGFIWPKQNPSYRDMSTKEVFKYTTDGEFCPISTCFKPDEFLGILKEIGFKGKFTGASISLDEMMWLPQRFEALKSHALDIESREFLSCITFDNRGIPYYDGNVAGIDGCFVFEKI